jgi:hypothetical protein
MFSTTVARMLGTYQCTIEHDSNYRYLTKHGETRKQARELIINRTVCKFVAPENSRNLGHGGATDGVSRLLLKVCIVRTKAFQKFEVSATSASLLR